MHYTCERNAAEACVHLPQGHIYIYDICADTNVCAFFLFFVVHFLSLCASLASPTKKWRGNSLTSESNIYFPNYHRKPNEVG